MQKRIKMKGCAEQDCFTRWRHLLCYLGRPGVKKSIRRAYNRRLRRTARAEMRDAMPT